MKTKYEYSKDYCSWTCFFSWFYPDKLEGTEISFSDIPDYVKSNLFY